jgi:hypothetical protein
VWVASLPDDDKPPGPRLSEWTPEVGLLAALTDRLGELIAVTVAANSGKKPESPKMTPRPRTAVDRALRDASRTRALSIIDEINSARAAQEG